MAFGLKVLNHTGSETPDKFFADLQADMAVLDKLDGQVALSGTATSGTATSLTDTSLALGANALVGTFILIWRNGAMLRAEQVTGNTATTISFATGAVVAAGDTYSIFANANALAVSEKGALNGVATLDATGKVVERLSYEGVANGVPTLDAAGNIVQRNAAEGLANGVATLDANGELAQQPAGAAATATTNPEALLRADGGWAVPLVAHIGTGSQTTGSIAGDTTWKKVILDNVVLNPANITTTGNQFTVPSGSPWVNSYCVLSGAVYLPANVGNINRARIVRTRGGATTVIGVGGNSQGAGANTTRRITVISAPVQLQAGDIFHLEFYHNAGQGTQVTHNSGVYNTWLAIRAVGAF